MPILQHEHKELLEEMFKTVECTDRTELRVSYSSVSGFMLGVANPSDYPSRLLVPPSVRHIGILVENDEEYTDKLKRRY